MKARFFTLVFIVLTAAAPAQAQKKPLDHSVYDGWQSVGESLLSNDGKWLVYTITPQEGDGRLVIRATSGDYAKEIPRGADATITEDGRFVIFLIHPFFKDSREARIRKRTPDQSPKDSLGWLELGTDHLVKMARVKSYKVAEKNGEWLAYLTEKLVPATPDSATRIRLLMARADSLARVADSLRHQVAEVEAKGWKAASAGSRGRGGATVGETQEEGTDLVLLNLHSGAERRFPLTSEYTLSAEGNTLIVETTSRNADSLSKAFVLWVNTANGKTDTVLRGFHDAKNYALDEAGAQLAFVAERDSVPKALVKFYRLWYYTPGMDSAIVRADAGSIAAALAASPNHPSPLPPTESKGFTVSSDFTNAFSKDGSRLYIGLAPIRTPKDTNLVDFETARLDVWNYNDDYLSPQQLVQANNELKRSYLAVLPKGESRLVPLGDADCETVIPGQEGNGRYALGMTSRPYRIQQQWEQSGLQKLYLIDMADGSRRPVQDKVRGGATLSPGGQYILWYDWKGRNWYTYSTASGKVNNITAGIRAPLYDEEDDHPDDPPPHGMMGWLEGDREVYIYDKYDIWQCDPEGRTPPECITRGVGRRQQLTFRTIRLDQEERRGREGRLLREDSAVHAGQVLLLTVFNQRDMSEGFVLHRLGSTFDADTTGGLTGAQSYNGFFKAKKAAVYGWLRGNFDKPYDVYVDRRQYSQINPQQKDYNWLTVELHHWKMLDGKQSEGLLYKPEDFDSTKKYPVIFYFYERDARTRYDYIAPQPVRASINIAYFVSNGYLVFDPDIYYKTGQPGEDAYNSVISAARYLSRFKWVDTTKMGLQGHSWGGYQVAYLVTRTHLFAAAEAGAPVANMTSAYGGIRWESGISRQFQYEKSQSRIGSTLWQRPDLYLKNSPLFRADKVTTPLLMMHNDADGAVPWYQGIEYFSALRRLGKKTWLIEYNGEGHGLTERRDRKDWSMRLSQFFGYYLKGERAPRWMVEGVPATLKGIDWGLTTE
ncbi:alpha/beta hydrolase family protein [Puia dinghuensis]|uniref:Peptidase S9 n=1 Tax=Puia dinghuensis TaxID=1792502 RepID=A0A8J2XSA7_9BACT|nr:prolyl oligopeptidase family serine peptidase [Puia dinghuensis]GGA93918.1 peptidase S9 [Puia dinghuensis]